MKNSPLQLDQHCLTAVHLDACVDSQVKDQVKWRIDCKVGTAIHKDDPRKWKVDLTVEFKSEDEAFQPYKGSCSFTGFFTVDAAYPEDKVKMLVETNAPSILYGSIREMCCNLTARGPWPMVMLPTQSFYNSPAKPATTAPEANPAKAV